VAKVTDVAENTVETDLREYVVTAPIERALTRLLDVPGDVLDKLQIIFFSDPINAAFRAMELD
jgi:predicted ATP-dependent Lon-type protease